MPESATPREDQEAAKRTADGGEWRPGRHSGEPLRSRSGVLVRAGCLAVRAAVGLPLALAAVPMALFGGSEPAARAQRATVRRYGPGWMTEPPGGTGAARTLRHSAVILLPSAASFALVTLSATVALSGYLYGFRPDASYAAFSHPFTPEPAFHGAWGGPTLAGAWFVHAMTALGIHVVCLAAIRLLTALQDRVSRRMLGASPGNGSRPAH